MPPTPPPSSPTPGLPEEGGPPGGTLSGYIYIDRDGDGMRDADEGTSGGTVECQQLGPAGEVLETFVVPAGMDGRWEARALPDGDYRVMFEPPLRDPSLGNLASPPVREVVVSPLQTVRRSVLSASIISASRVEGLNFGIPYEGPLAAPPINLPSTGQGSTSAPGLWRVASIVALALVAAAAVCAWRGPSAGDFGA